MTNLILQIFSGIAGLWLAKQFIDGVVFEGPIYILLLAGLILGLINFFIKPILKLLTLPIRLLTFGLFGLVMDMIIIWGVSILFVDYLDFKGIMPLFWTTIIIWGSSIVIPLLSKGSLKK